MPQIRRILFPVDFRFSCYGGARYAEALAGHFDARIMLLHVVSPDVNADTEKAVASQRSRLEAFLSGDLKYLKTDHLCVSGKPEVVIAETAHSWKPDLVMLPSRGLRFLRREYEGSVTARLLGELASPIWTSVHAENAPHVEAIHFRRVLCSLDLELHSREVLSWAQWFAGQYEAELAILHATQPVAVPVVRSSEANVRATKEAETRIDEIAEAAGASALRRFVIEDSPAPAISRAAEDFHPDLVVIGRHSGDGGPADLINNVYSIVHASPCPVVSL